MPDPKSYLFLPIANIRGLFKREPELNDGYIQQGIDSFLATNPEENYILSRKKLSWTNNAELSSIELEYRKKFKDQLAQIVRKSPPKRNSYLGRLRYPSKSENQLAGLNSNDMLFVLGHGNWSTQYLCRKDEVEEDGITKVDTYFIDAPTLAATIEKSGLPKTHKKIKLNSCFGGSSDIVIPFTNNKLSSAVLAKNLAKALGDLGYADIEVGAYAYMTKHQTNGTDLYLEALLRDALGNMYPVKVATIQTAYSLRAGDYEEDPYRIWYKSDGSMVRWNEPDIPAGCSKPEMLDPEAHPEIAEYQRKVREWEEYING